MIELYSWGSYTDGGNGKVESGLGNGWSPGSGRNRESISEDNWLNGDCWAS